MVLNDRSLDTILSLSLFVRPSAVFHIRINFFKTQMFVGLSWTGDRRPFARPLHTLDTERTGKGKHLCPDCHSDPQSQYLRGLKSCAA